MAVTTTIRSSLEWARGHAHYHDRNVVMEIPFGTFSRIEMSDGADVELARVQTPDDAIAFVRTFGLLTKGYHPDPFEKAPSLINTGRPTLEDTDRLRPGVPTVDREPFDLFTATADDLRNILLRMKQVRAAIAGDKDARQALEAWAATSDAFKAFEAKQPAMAVFSDDNNALLRTTTDYIAERLNAGLTTESKPPTTTFYGQPASLFDPRESPDRLTLSVQCQTLRGFVYWTVGQKLISRNPIVACPECGFDFVVMYGGKERIQRFCSRNCARRNRYRESQKENDQ